MNYPLHLAWCRDHFARESGNGNDKLLKKWVALCENFLTPEVEKIPGEGTATHSSILPVNSMPDYSPR